VSTTLPRAGGRLSFDAMGCEVVVAGADPNELAAVRRLFASRDEMFSRFRADSELAAVNRSCAPLVVVSPLFAETLAHALHAATATRGLVDPTLGAAVEAAGYDRDFALLTDDPRPPGPAAPGRWREVRLTGRLLERPPGLLLDLNGVVKALAVDAAVALIKGDGYVAAGGDIATQGPAVVGLPGGGSLRLLAGGMATSGTARRRWSRAGEPQHHLIDPRTGRPSTSCWTEVTVAAGSCVGADIAAKAAFLLGKEGPDWLDRRELPGRLVAVGEIRCNDSWRRALAGEL
jgi:thiamine biosynthesis lipoprotein